MILLPAGLGIYSLVSIASEYWLVKITANSSIFTTGMFSNDCKILSNDSFVLSSNNGKTLIGVDNSGTITNIKSNTYTNTHHLARKSDNIVLSAASGGVDLDTTLNATNLESITGISSTFVQYDATGNKYFAFVSGGLIMVVSFNASNTLRWARSITPQANFTMDAVLSLKVGSFILVEYSRHSATATNKCFFAFSLNGTSLYANTKYVNSNSISIDSYPCNEDGSCIINYSTSTVTQTSKTNTSGAGSAFLNANTKFLFSDQNNYTYLNTGSGIFVKYLYGASNSVVWHKTFSLINYAAVAEYKGTYLILFIPYSATVAYLLKYPLSGNITGTFGDLTIATGGSLSSGSSVSLNNSSDVVAADSTNWTVSSSSPGATSVISGVSANLNTVG